MEITTVELPEDYTLVDTGDWHLGPLTCNEYYKGRYYCPEAKWLMREPCPFLTRRASPPAGLLPRPWLLPRWPGLFIPEMFSSFVWRPHARK